MPRKSVVPPAEAVEVLKNHIGFFTTNQLPAWSHEVWKTMSAAVDRRWSPMAWHLNVAQNRHNILTKARQEKGIDIAACRSSASMQEQYSDADNCSSHSSISTGESSEDCYDPVENTDKNQGKNKKFEVILSEEDWNKISPDSNNKRSLKKGIWASVIAFHFWKQHRLPCAFVFKRAEVTIVDDLQYNVKLLGQCKSPACRNKIQGYAHKAVSMQGIVFTMITRDTSKETSHEDVKRPLRGKWRRDVQKDLKSQGSAVWRKKYASKHMQAGEVEPPIMPCNNVLNQARQEGMDRDRGIAKTDTRDAIIAIAEMKRKPKYFGAIHDIGHDPFFVFYSSPAQLHAYREYCRVTKQSVINIDATGSVVRSIQRGNGESKHIFLYAIVINFEKTTICVHSMISEKHTVEMIFSWLRHWQRMGAPTPREVICDYSRALLCAISLAFNNETIKTHVNTIGKDILAGKKRKPSTRIRIDVAHFIHAVCRWKCWRRVRQPCIKDFFVRCIGLMMECTELDEFEEIFYLTCVVGQQSHEDSIVSHSYLNTAKEARKRLEDCIANRGIPMNIDSSPAEDTKTKKKEIDAIFDEESLSEEDCEINEWIRSRVAKATKATSTGNDLNPFYIPEFIQALTQRAMEFPLWTNIGMDSKEHATSSYVESYFNDLKTRVLKNSSRPLRADKFLIEHQQDINGATLLFESKMLRYDENKRQLKAISEHKGILTDIHHSSSVENYDIAPEIEYQDMMTDFGTQDISSFVEVSDNADVRMDDSDLLAYENWKGKVDLEINKIVDNAWSSNDEKGVEIEIMELTTNLDHSYAKATDFKDQEIRISHEYEKTLISAKETSLKDQDDTEIVKASKGVPVPEKKIHGRERKLEKESKFFKKYPEIRHVNDLMCGKKKAVILPNGSLCPPVGVKEQDGKKSHYYMTNTCAFDAVIHILTIAGVDNIHYGEFLQASSNATARLAYGIIQNGIKKGIFEERAQILRQVFKPKTTMETQQRTISYTIDCTSSVAYTIEKIMESEPSIRNMEECSHCNGSNYNTLFLAPDHRIIGQRGFGALEESLHYLSPVYRMNCRNKCAGRSCTLRRRPNIHLFVELDIRSLTQPTDSLKCQLGDLPYTIRLTENSLEAHCEYRLAGVIEYKANHFIAYCRRTNGGWQKYDDLQKEPVASSRHITIYPQMAVYIRTM